MLRFITVLILNALIVCLVAKMQSTAVNGLIKCDGIAEEKTKVELWDKDRLDPDDLMSSEVTNFYGRFHLNGNESELTKIDPEVRM